MFTGLIEEIGTVLAIRRQEDAAYITVAAQHILPGLQKGDSISVDGVCLSAIEIAENRFIALAMRQTLLGTTLGKLTSGRRVNLERALRADGRFGGHIVQGHVDAVGRVGASTNEGPARRLEICADPSTMNLIVEKGSIAINGVSLTIATVLPNSFTVGLIPHTQNVTTLRCLHVGDEVNLETDIIGKYVAKFLSLQEVTLPKQAVREEGLNAEFLRKHGFA